MKKSRLLLFVAFFLFIGVTAVFVKNVFGKPSITKVLQSDAYSYLSEEAKEYVEDVYEETGEIVHTEKNKEENVPYLNPKFVEYLSATPEEKEKMEIIPTAYTVEYSVLEEVAAPLPATYDLRNVNGNSYVSSIKNQNPLNLCWSFASASQVESKVMLLENRPFDSSNPFAFSTRQIDYAASTDGIKDYTNENGMRELSEGGNFLTASLILYNGLGLVSESSMPFNTSSDQKELYSVLNYGNSLYEVDSSILFPVITSSTSAETINSYVTVMKQYVKNNGGMYVETEAPGYSCGSTNSDGTHIIRVDDGCTENAGHAMQIIGWDDNYTYSYCKSGNAHSSNTSGCSSNNLVTGQGAWLLRNSWGNSYPYVYLAYDSVDDNYYTFNTVSSMENRKWDNNYHKTVDTFTIYKSTYDTQTFEKNIDTTEKIEKIKFFTYGQGGKYKVYVYSGDNTYTTSEVTVNYPGVYTLDVSKFNMLLEEDEFEVIVVSLNSVYFLKNTVSVFTSNVDKTPIIHTPVDTISFDASNTGYVFRLLSYTKNIPANASIHYSLWNKSGENVSSYLTVSNSIVAENNVNALVNIGSNISEGNYVLRLTYQDVEENIPVTLGDVGSFKVYYYANDGTSNTMIQAVLEGEGFHLNANTFVRTGYIFNGWNTEQDGTGVAYENGQAMSALTRNISLYAQWTPITYTVHYMNNGGTGTMESQIFTYDQSKKLSANTFTMSGYAFASWNTNADGSGTTYQDEATVFNLSTAMNGIVNLYAQWVPITYSVRFVANGGTGFMDNQVFSYNQAQNLNKNIFTRSGYNYISWNTKADGSGDTYQDEAEIYNLFTTSGNMITLYAQWAPITYTIQFNANGGTGEMNDQTLAYNQQKKLNKNTFTREGYVFLSWNTKSNGRGMNYVDEEAVKNLSSVQDGVVTLYAQWKIDLPYTISHYTVDYADNTIDSIEIGTTLENYRSYFNLGEDYSISIDLGDKNVIYTGSVVKIYHEEELVSSYTNIVRGDSNGDGVVNSGDLLKMVKHMKGTGPLTGVYLKAADCNYDDTINSGDLLKVIKFLKGTGTI